MFERGEANIDYQTSAAYLANVVPLVDEGLAVPIFTWGALDDDGNIVRDPTFPDLPSFKEVCEATEGCETEGTAWDAFKAFFIAGFANQKTIFLPGSAPQEVVDMYTEALRRREGAARLRRDLETDARRLSAADRARPPSRRPSRRPRSRPRPSSTCSTG